MTTIKRLSSSDRDDVEVLYSTYRSLVEEAVRPFLKRLSEEHEDLDDLTQSAWEQVMIKYNQLRDLGDPEIYLTSVAKLAMQDKVRAMYDNKRSGGVSLDALVSGRDGRSL